MEAGRFPSPSEVLDSFWVPNSNPSFQASASIMNFNEQEIDQGSEDYAGCYLAPEKKRRLSPEQVHFLEQSFEVENRLEPERKVQLAKELGLHPRQVAIWFQNRRARYKTKHIEKEYDSLKISYHQLKADFDSLSMENEKLRNEVQLLTERMKGKEKGKRKQGVSSPIVACKQEDASSAKSDVFDSDSPVYTDGMHSSEFSQSPSCFFPKLREERREEEEEEEEQISLHGPLTGSCSLGFSIDDQMSPWFWP